MCVCACVGLCLCISKLCVYSIRSQSSIEEHLHRPLVLISLCATLHVNIRGTISILLILCHVYYQPSLVEQFQGDNLLMGFNSLFVLHIFFHRLLFLPAHYIPLSLSDLSPEGSSGGRHPADNTGQEPGPQGWCCEGLYWRRAMHHPAWSLHSLCKVSNITYGCIMIHKFAHVGLCQLSSSACLSIAVCIVGYLSNHFRYFCSSVISLLVFKILGKYIHAAAGIFEWTAFNKEM